MATKTEQQSQQAFKNPRVVSQEEWEKARKEFLEEEKQFTHQRDQLIRKRQQLPWVLVEKEYRFECVPSSSGTSGETKNQMQSSTSGDRVSLSDLFHDKHQLIVYHYMFAPDWRANQTKHCAFWADQFSKLALIHLNQRDTSFVVVSRAPVEKIRELKERMNWEFEWVSSNETDFNYDFHVSFKEDELKRHEAEYNYQKKDPHESDREGISVFYKQDDGKIYHTYSAYERGIDMLNLTYNLLDLTPKGRNEDPSNPLRWIRLHDRYESTSSESSREREGHEEEGEQRGSTSGISGGGGGRMKEKSKQTTPSKSGGGGEQEPTNAPTGGGSKKHEQKNG